MRHCKNTHIRATQSRSYVPERLVDSRPVTVATFGWLSRTYARDGLPVRVSGRGQTLYVQS